MQDKQNWLTIAAIVLVVAGLGVFLYRQSQQPAPEVEIIDQEDEARAKADQFLQNLDVTIPDGATRINLKDIADVGGAGIVTRNQQAGMIAQSILVSLPDPQPGEHYEAYLVADDEAVADLYLGKLRSLKGGWNLDYRLSQQQAESYKTVQITRETSDDRQKETVLMEAAFPVETETPNLDLED